MVLVVVVVVMVVMVVLVLAVVLVVVVMVVVVELVLVCSHDYRLTCKARAHGDNSDASGRRHAPAIMQNWQCIA